MSKNGVDRIRNGHLFFLDNFRVNRWIILLNKTELLNILESGTVLSAEV
jgi:hypothetical protein